MKEKVSDKSKEIVLDAQEAVVGRLASFAAKKLLQGNKIRIINSKKAIIIGHKEDILEKYLAKRRLGHGAQKGPHYPSKPDMMLRRTIRGMLPWKRTRGKEAYKKLLCFEDAPEQYKDKAIALEKQKKEPLNFITLENLSKLVRQK